MASGLFALLDDIATLLDDVSVMTKVAAKKTAGVLGDDLALNAQQVTGVNADRELPVVWAVAKGSAVNKTILVPAALAISALEVWMRSRGINIPLIMPLLMIGGAFLCFEGVEKLAHKFLHSAKEDEQHHAELLDAVKNEQVDMVAFEKDKIKGAVRTDFILSAEIIVISLGTVAAQPFMKQFGVLVGISVLMTVGVYGLVGAIVKIDDVGLYLSARAGDGLAAVQRAVGRFLLWGAPKLMKFLSVAGTAAMFLVGGGIITHNIPALHHIIEPYAHGCSASTVSMALQNAIRIDPCFLVTMAYDAVVGILLGIVVLGAVHLFKKLRGR